MLLLHAPLHYSYLLVGQAVEGVDDLVNEVVGLFQSIGDLAILVSVAVVDLQEIGQVGHRADQFAQEVFKGGWRPGQRLGQVVSVRVLVDVGLAAFVLVEAAALLAALQVFVQVGSRRSAQWGSR